MDEAEEDPLTSAVLAQAQTLVTRRNPFAAYLEIRDRQMALGEWHGPLLSKEEQYRLQKWDLLIGRF